jgi:hypothetical protein
MAKKSESTNNAFVVLASGERSPISNITQNSDGTADIEFVFNGSMMTITSSPRDDEGKKPDSHHFGTATPASNEPLQ